MAETKEVGTKSNLVVYQARDGVKVELSIDIIKRFLVQGHGELVTPSEAVYFMGVCKARGLNPFKKDCYLIKYSPGDNAAIVTSIDYYRARAKAQPDCQGWKTGIVVEDKSENIIYREGCFMRPGETLIGGWFEARPERWTEPLRWAVPLAPYVKKTREGKITQFWREENQPYQIAKVAESQGLRRVWPDEFQGMFLEDEVTEPRDISPSGFDLPKEQLEKAQADLKRVPRGKRQEEPPPPEPEEQTEPENEEPPPEAAQSDYDKAMAWAKESPTEHLLPATLSKMIKPLGMTEKMDICKVYNERTQPE